MERPQYIIIAFENDNFNEPTHDASTFLIMNFTECYCNVDSQSYPEDRKITIYGTNNYNEAFKEIVNFNKDYNGLPHNIKPYINHRTFRSSFRKYVIDTGSQNDHIGPQPIQLNFKFSAAVADVMCHALVLTRKVIIVNSDGNKQFILYLSYILVISNSISIDIINKRGIVIVLALVNVIVNVIVKLFSTSLNKTFSINSI